MVFIALFVLAMVFMLIGDLIKTVMEAIRADARKRERQELAKARKNHPTAR